MRVRESTLTRPSVHGESGLRQPAGDRRKPHTVRSVIEVTVHVVGIAPPSSLPLLLLKEREGERVLPVGIGPNEAQAIVMPLQGVRPPRPMTHDIFVEVVASL